MSTGGISPCSVCITSKDFEVKGQGYTSINFSTMPGNIQGSSGMANPPATSGSHTALRVLIGVLNGVSQPGKSYNANRISPSTGSLNTLNNQNSTTGTYIGNLSSNPYAPNSTSNPYGKYGSPYFFDSINNPYGAGNPYLQDSPNNPYGSGFKIIGQ